MHPYENEHLRSKINIFDIWVHPYSPSLFFEGCEKGVFSLFLPLSLIHSLSAQSLSSQLSDEVSFYFIHGENSDPLDSLYKEKDRQSLSLISV